MFLRYMVFINMVITPFSSDMALIIPVIWLIPMISTVWFIIVIIQFI